MSFIDILTGNEQYQRHAAIASAHPLATRAGFEILSKGGNVFDSAVAVGAALAVVEPSGSGLGGGGYWLLHRANDGFETMIDGREKAPFAASKDMFLDSRGKVIPKLSTDGALAAGIPGMPAALVHLSERYGRLPLTESLKPAIRYAEIGFAVGKKFRKLLGRRREVINRFPSSSRIFLHQGRMPELFSILRQPELAKTLKHIALEGRDGFYRGDVAPKLVKSVRAAGGIWSEDDLEAYRVVERRCAARSPVVTQGVANRGMRVAWYALTSAWDAKELALAAPAVEMIVTGMCRYLLPLPLPFIATCYRTRYRYHYLVTVHLPATFHELIVRPSSFSIQIASPSWGILNSLPPAETTMLPSSSSHLSHDLHTHPLSLPSMLVTFTCICCLTYLPLLLLPVYPFLTSTYSAPPTACQ